MITTSSSSSSSTNFIATQVLQKLQGRCQDTDNDNSVATVFNLLQSCLETNVFWGWRLNIKPTKPGFCASPKPGCNNQPVTQTPSTVKPGLHSPFGSGPTLQTCLIKSTIVASLLAQLLTATSPAHTRKHERNAADKRTPPHVYIILYKMTCHVTILHNSLTPQSRVNASQQRL